MLIILDIDETLIHSICKDEVTEDIQELIQDGLLFSFEIDDFVVTMRPGLSEFIECIMGDNYYDVAVWSAGEETYVHSIVNKIIPNKRKLAFVMTRNDCDGDNYAKPLFSAWKQYNQYLDKKGFLPMEEWEIPHEILIIDDKFNVTAHDEANHLHIPAFEGDPMDETLIKLSEILDSAKYNSTTDAISIISDWKYYPKTKWQIITRSAQS